MILMYKYLCYNNVNSVILTQFSCDLLYVFILVQSFTLFVGKIALMANVLICYNWMPTLNKVSCILYLVITENHSFTENHRKPLGKSYLYGIIPS